MIEIAIKGYIEKEIHELAGRLYPLHTTDLSKLNVVYTYTPISGGHLSQTQLELKVIDKDYDECKRVEKELLALLDMEEDESDVATGGYKFHSELSGGGTLFNEGCQRYENTLYFISKWRKTNVI